AWNIRGALWCRVAAFALHRVGTIDACGLHRNQHLVLARHGRRTIDEAEDVGTTGLRNLDGAHGHRSDEGRRGDESRRSKAGQRWPEGASRSTRARTGSRPRTQLTMELLYGSQTRVRCPARSRSVNA